MKKPRLFRTLYSRLALTFACAIFLFLGIQFFVLHYLWLRAEHERSQRVNWGVASVIARHLTPLVQRGADEAAVSAEILRLSELNPIIEAYILDENGRPVLPRILFKTKHVPPALLEQVLALQPNRTFPIYGPTPRRGDGYSTVFSVSRFVWRNKPAYVYVILDSSRNRYTSQVLLQTYLLFGGMFSSAIIAFFAIGLGCTLFFFITKRFRSVTAAVREIAQGNLNARAIVQGDDEIAELGTKVNQMADTITASIDTINAKDRLRREMVASISHDLRGPVASLKAYLESLLSRFRSTPEDEKERKLQVMAKNTQMLSALLDELFELSKLDANEAKLEPEAFSILDMVSEELLLRCNILADELGVKLNAELPEALPRVYADFRMIYRVLSNLVENALRYSGAGSSVCVCVKRDGEMAKVTVRDNGAGIAPEDLPRIFDPFFTRNNARTKGSTGTGLGLAIVKKILELHGRQIEVSSAPGRGTSFSFLLPLHDS